MPGSIGNDWKSYLNGGTSFNLSYRSELPPPLEPVPTPPTAPAPPTALTAPVTTVATTTKSNTKTSTISKKTDKIPFPVLKGGKRKSKRNTKKCSHTRRK